MTVELLGIVQARMTSTRLPGKVLLSLAGRTVLERVVRAALAGGAVDELVIATSTDGEDDAIAREADRLGLACHRGDRDDVLGRFLGTLAAYPARAVMRFTADCPLLDPDIIATTARVFGAARVDYVSTGLGGTLPRGLDVEVITADALRSLGGKATGHHRSHVTSYVYTHPEVYTTLGLAFAPNRAHHRLTLDTPDDWSLLTAIAEHFGDGMPSVAAVTAWLDANPAVSALNAHIRQKALEDG
ncbi:cytidylyltransferase domain-containing protein [Stackebrandtia soli]|uniref:cytidylyltransferase domain-containing protein n=1 Tax=Stackebrandtia soli TaxID=1892856 RepID=UPI0039ECE8EA